MSESRQRVLKLLLALLEGEHTLAQLADQLGASQRSLRYDLDALEAVGLGVQHIQSSGGDRPGRQPTRYTLSPAARARLQGSATPS